MFKGREKNYVIFSLVRANKGNRIGFMEDKRRLNVAITRAKYGLVIVGSLETFKSANKWNMLIKEYIKANLVHQGFTTTPYVACNTVDKFVPDVLETSPIKCNIQHI